MMKIRIKLVGWDDEKRMKAIIAGGARPVAALLEAGFEIDSKDKNGFSLLHYAVFAGNLQIIFILCLNNANINIQNENGHTPLYLAVLIRNTEIVEFLLKKRAEVTESEISLATTMENHELVELLREQQSKALSLEAEKNQDQERAEASTESSDNSLQDITTENDSSSIVNYVNKIIYDRGDPYSLYYRNNKDTTKEEGKIAHFYKTIYHFDLNIGHPDEKLQNQLDYYMETGRIFATLQEAVNQGEVILYTEQELQGSMFIPQYNETFENRNMVNESEHNQNNITDSGGYSLDFSGIIHSAIIAKFFDSSC